MHRVIISGGCKWGKVKEAEIPVPWWSAVIVQGMSTLLSWRERTCTRLLLPSSRELWNPLYPTLGLHTERKKKSPHVSLSRSDVKIYAFIVLSETVKMRTKLSGKGNWGGWKKAVESGWRSQVSVGGNARLHTERAETDCSQQHTWIIYNNSHSAVFTAPLYCYITGV